VKSFENKSLFVGIANTMSNGMDMEGVRSDTTISTRHIRSILQFVESVGNKENGLRFDWKYYENDDHGSVPLITEYDAMRFLFDWHQFEEIPKVFDSTATVNEAVGVVKAHYEKLSNRFGYEVLPDQELVSMLGYYLIEGKMLDKAAALFDLNIASFPKNSKTYNSRADCYLAAGDTLMALEFYKKAYKAERNDYSPKKIDELTKGG
ncbi:MAG: hypothetical protein OEX02_14840, partial [Cyclobacteriaceae bacterium]|nr:hypothetical protein [Cyclobacteriaceae bacterium]